MRELSDIRLGRISRLWSNISRRLGYGLHLGRRSHVGDVVLDETAALDAEDDEEDPADELADTAEDEHGDAAVPFTHVGGDTVIAVGGVVGVATAVGAVAVAVAGEDAEEGAADDEEDDGGDEETDTPPFGNPRAGRRAVLSHREGRVWYRWENEKLMNGKVGRELVLGYEQEKRENPDSASTPDEGRDRRVLKEEQTLH